jgi:hypothetical protein
VLKALASLGDMAFVEQALAPPSFRNDARLAAEIRRNVADTRVVNRLCWF